MKNFLRNSYDLLFNRYASVTFLICLLLIGWLYNYPQIVHYKPQSFHQFRQADCLSLALNYYQDDLPFHTPAIHNQIADEATTGYSAGEFPLLYYTIAQFWKIFGYHLWMYRAFNALLLILGLWCLFRLLNDWLKDFAWAAGIAVIAFASPVIAYYGANYLTNITSFSLVLMAWFLFYRYVRSQKKSFLLFCILLFTLAGLMKVSSLITCVAWFLLWIFHELKWFGVHRFHLFRHRWIMAGGLIFLIASLYGWYHYAQQYNNIHRAQYTFNDMTPIWKMNRTQIIKTWYDFTHILVAQWYHRIALVVFAMMYLFCLAMLPKTWKKLSALYAGLFLVQGGSVLYMLCWYQLIGNHDYYLIEVVPAFILLSVTFALVLKTVFPAGYKTAVARTAFLLFVAFNLFFGKTMMDVRYFRLPLDWHHPHPLFSKLECGYWYYFNAQHKDKIQYMLRLDTFLDGLGVGREEKIIYLPDDSMNIPFVLSGRKGNNGYWNRDLQGKERIEFFRRHGATILIIDDSEYLKQPFMQEYLPREIGSDGPIHVFRI